MHGGFLYFPNNVQYISFYCVPQEDLTDTAY